MALLFEILNVNSINDGPDSIKIIVKENGCGRPSSNSGRGCLRFTSPSCICEKYEYISPTLTPAMSKIMTEVKKTKYFHRIL